MMYTIGSLLTIVGCGIFGLVFPQPYLFAMCLVGLGLVEYHYAQHRAQQRHEQTMKAIKALIRRR